MGELTPLAVTALGEHWKASLEEIGCWKTTSHQPEEAAALRQQYWDQWEEFSIGERKRIR